MTATTSHRSPRSSWDMSQPRSSHRQFQLPSTTPLGMPVRAPASVGQAMPPPMPFTKALSPIPQDTRASSPNYFGLIVDSSNVPADSDDNRHPRGGWSPPSSSVRSTAAPSPRVLPLDANPEFEAFRRQSENHAFRLGQGHLSQFSGSGDTRNATPQTPFVQPQDQAQSLSPNSRPAVFNRESSSDQMDVDPPRPFSQSSMGLTRFESPASMSPGTPVSAQRNEISYLDDRHPRLSLPHNRVEAPSPLALSNQTHRAATLPGKATNDDLRMINSPDLLNLMNSDPQGLLLLDLRVYSQFSQARIWNALNLCISTTLLKRASFTVDKLAETFSKEPDRSKFEKWREARHIVVYDDKSSTIRDAASAVNTLKKFPRDQTQAQLYILQGGFKAFSQIYPHALDSVQNADPKSSSGKGLSIKSLLPVAGGCPMPKAKTAANPFFDNIRQNMDLIGGVGKMDLKRPAGMTAQHVARLPRWLQVAANPADHGQIVSDKFLHIEQAEQSRMQAALSSGNMAGSGKKHCQIAGIENGSKNRYKNIWPFDHSRVKLQEIAEGACDYINANYVQAAWSNKKYIATQAPIPATFDDFWKVVWEQDVRVIVMLTAESEGGQTKCHRYWANKEFGPLKLKPLSERRVTLDPSRSSRSASRRFTSPPLADFQQTSSTSSPAADGRSKDDTPNIIVRKFALSHAAHPFAPIREITQLSYPSWPDFGAPAHAAHLLGLVEQCNAVVRASESSISPPSTTISTPSTRPVLVHCSAGCGRTGTFCTVDSVIDMLKQSRAAAAGQLPAQQWMGGSIDLVEETVKQFREERISMVQNLGQFVLAYETVLEWCMSVEGELVGMPMSAPILGVQQEGVGAMASAMRQAQRPGTQRSKSARWSSGGGPRTG